jgi:hypothetical protein
MRENDHDHTVHNLLLLEFSKDLGYWEIFNLRMDFPKSCSCQNVLAKDILNEVSHCDIHVNLAGRGDATLLEILLPKIKVCLLQLQLPFMIELREFIFKEFGHYSEAGPVEEEIKLLVVLLRLGISNIYLCHLLLLLFLRSFNILR